jgi:YbbR domain-containing protein
VNKRRPIIFLDRLRPEASSVGLAVLSLALSALFWAYTVSELKSVKDVSVPLQYANVPTDLIVVGDDARRTVTVEFKGPPDMLKRVREEDVDARIDVDKLKPGPQVVELGQENVRLPSSVEFVRTFPKLVHFALDRRLRDSLPMQPNFTGHAASGLQVVSWTIEPPTVQVEGPESVIRKLRHLPTQPVPLDGRSSSFETPVVPTFSEPDLTVTMPGTATLRVVLGEKRAQRTLGPVPIKVLHAHLPVTLQPDAIRVMVEGPEPLVRRMSPEDLQAEVDVRSLKPGESPYQVRPAVRVVNPSLAAKIAITGWMDRFVSVEVGTPQAPPPGQPVEAPGVEGGIAP